MKHKHYDAIVIGLGAMGSSACRYLSQRGAAVLGLEQHAIPNTEGSSHGFSRMIRLAYYEHPDYVPLLRKAYALWDELDLAGSQRLFLRTGTLYLGAAGSELVGGSSKSAGIHHIPHEMLDATEIRRRWPQFELPADFVGFYERSGGMLLPERVVSRFCALALSSGAELHGHERVTAWTEHPSHVEVTTDRGRYAADQLLVCAGPWTGRVLRQPNLPLVVTRQVMGWIWPNDPSAFAIGRFPTWALDTGDGTLHYGFPLHADDLGLKVAHHARGTPTEPDAVDRHTTTHDEADFRPALAKYVPAADGPLLAMRTCLYTNTPDSHFIIDRLPGSRRVAVAAGFSGHGFKFATVVGSILADLVTSGATTEPIDLFQISRLR
jgi:sarcosine oxidase